MALRRTAATSRKRTNVKGKGTTKTPKTTDLAFGSANKPGKFAASGRMVRPFRDFGGFVPGCHVERAVDESFSGDPAGILSIYDSPSNDTSRRSETLVFRLLAYRASYGKTTFLTRGNEGNRDPDGKVWPFPWRDRDSNKSNGQFYILGRVSGERKGSRLASRNRIRSTRRGGSICRNFSST